MISWRVYKIVHETHGTEIVLTSVDITSLDVLVDSTHISFSLIVQTTQPVEVQTKQVPVSRVAVPAVRHIRSTHRPVPDLGSVEAILTERLFGEFERLAGASHSSPARSLTVSSFTSCRTECVVVAGSSTLLSHTSSGAVLALGTFRMTRLSRTLHL